MYSADCVTRMLLTLVAECNDLPRLDETGDAIWRRLEVIPFNSSFVEKRVYDELDDEVRNNGNIFLQKLTLNFTYLPIKFSLIIKYLA